MAGRPRREIDTNEQQVGQDSFLDLPSSGSIIREEQQIEVVTQPIQNDYAAELAFMEEPVEVMVHESTDPNAENPIHVGCNGVNQFFFRGQQQTVKRKFVEILARAKPVSYMTHEVVNGQGDRTTRITKASALRYPFSVVYDPNPRGATWLRSILNQA